MSQISYLLYGNKSRQSEKPYKPHTYISKLPTSGKKWNGTEKTDYFSTTEVECHMILCYLVALKLRL